MEKSERKKSTSCCGIKSFVGLLCFLHLFHMTLLVYQSGVIRTIERRFGLRSAQTGLIFAMNDIIHICLVLFIGYFGRKVNKPKVISVLICFTALGGLMMSLPYFIFPANDDFLSDIVEKYSNITKKDEGFCDSDRVIADENCGDTGTRHTNKQAYMIFLIAQLFTGIGTSALHTLGIAYIDENSPREKTALYLGILTSMFAVGPICGLLLAAFCTRLPENLWETHLNPGDPTFISCWWLGYIIASTLIIMVAIPMFFFPRTIHRKPQVQLEKLDQEITVQPPEKFNFKKEIKGFPGAFAKLITNPRYVTYLVMVVLSVYVIMGVFINIPRYLEIHFRQPAFKANIITALCTALSGALGALSGGVLMNRTKMELRGAIRMLIFSLSVSCVSLIIVINLRCPQVQLAGEYDEQTGRVDMETACNANCTCMTNKNMYQPVCGQDNLTYFSPCHAACDEQINGTYSSCSCVPGGQEAHSGLCLPPCDMITAYAITLFLSSLISSVGRVPGTIVMLRIVSDEERAFALGITSFCVNLLGFVPGPIIFGSLIDSTCLVWQYICGKTGVCLFFDTDRFRVLIHGVSLGFQLGSLAAAAILTCLIEIHFRDEKIRLKVATEESLLNENNINSHKNEAETKVSSL